MITRAQPVQAQTHRGPSASAVSIAHLSKSFGGRRVLADVSLEIAAGEFVAVVGRSGCGKSTLLRIIAGLEQADTLPRPTTRAPVCINGQPQDGLDTATCIMFQDARLLPWRRVTENVAIGLPRAKRGLATEILQQVGLAERGDDWPAVLSGGQRQRVALARALVHAPRLLLLDEPLGALDALTRIDMHRLIESIWLQERFTALLVTHDVSEAIALADRVVFIEHGRICLDLAIDLPRPRERGTAAFARYEREVLRRVLHLADEPDAHIERALASSGASNLAA